MRLWERERGAEEGPRGFPLLTAVPSRSVRRRTDAPRRAAGRESQAKARCVRVGRVGCHAAPPPDCARVGSRRESSALLRSGTHESPALPGTRRRESEARCVGVQRAWPRPLDGSRRKDQPTTATAANSALTGCRVPPSWGRRQGEGRGGRCRASSGGRFQRSETTKAALGGFGVQLS